MNLYTKFPKDQQEQNCLLENLENKVNNDQNKTPTKPITKKETQLAISEMEKGKAPGIDGLPVELYETNLNLIQIHLQPILFENKDLPKTLKRGIITLITKNNKTKHLKNWRPISLCCVDYKILTKILVTRLKRILKTTISGEQNCGIPHRTISSNLFAIRELINYTNDKKQKAFIIYIDQEKTFYKVDQNLLFQTMEKLGFSKQFIQLIKLFYRDTQALITNNGYLSKPLNISRGLKQGWLLLSYSM